MARNKKSKGVEEAAPIEMSAEAAPEAVAKEPKMDFDGWFAMRMGQIPAQHHKEIIKADFKARKVPMVATMAEFDEALNKYGIKLGK